MHRFSPRWLTRRWWFLRSSIWSHRFIEPSFNVPLLCFHSPFTLIITGNHYFPETWWSINPQWSMKLSNTPPQLYQSTRTCKLYNSASSDAPVKQTEIGFMLRCWPQLSLVSLQNVTKGARHKIALSIQKLRERQSVLKSLEKVIRVSGGGGIPFLAVKETAFCLENLSIN